jgi:hypothetical protein
VAVGRTERPEVDVTGPETDALIRLAITSKRLVRFEFHGCVRVAEPHDYGVRGGAEQLFVYQIGGESRSGTLPGWRWILVRDIADLELLEQTFPGGREAPSGSHSKWDEVYLRVDQPGTRR